MVEWYYFSATELFTFRLFNYRNVWASDTLASDCVTPL